CRSCILGRQDRDRAPVREANLLCGDRRRTCERGIRLNEFHQRGENSPLGLLEIVRDDEQLVWTLLRKCPPEGEGRVDRRLPALFRRGIDDGVVGHAAGLVERKRLPEDDPLMWLEPPGLAALVEREAVIDERDRIGEVAGEAPRYGPSGFRFATFPLSGPYRRPQ